MVRLIGITGILLSVMVQAIANEPADDLRPISLSRKLTTVQPMTGIVLWNTNSEVAESPIQLEYCYVRYDQVVSEKGRYNWEPVATLLREISERKHQAILRWHDTYVGQPTGVPRYIQSLPNFRETTASSEKQSTGFPDWSSPDWQDFVLEFFTEFAEKYDRDPRLAFVQVGFGLWAEYHIYDGPMKLGVTFPSLAYQQTFARHLAEQFQETPWMISVDAAGDHAPFANNKELLALPFGLFDDSFNHKRHQKENEPNWNAMGRDRWQKSPAGGEFSFFSTRDQREALSPKGPYRRMCRLLCLLRTTGLSKLKMRGATGFASASQVLSPTPLALAKPVAHNPHIKG